MNPGKRRKSNISEVYIYVVRHIHLALLLALIVPFVMLFDHTMTDAMFVKLYFSGLGVMIPAIFLYYMSEKSKNAGIYLLAAAAVVGAFGYLCWQAGERLFTGYGGTAFGVSNFLIVLLYAVDAFRERLNENGRAKAAEQNNPDWSERALLPGPSLLFLPIFGLLYVAALFTHRGGLCTAVMIGTLLYSFPAVFYIYAAGREEYLNGLKDIKGIPKSRIRKIGAICVLVFLIPMAAAAVITVSSAGSRSFLTMPEPVAKEDQGAPEELLQDSGMDSVDMEELTGVAPKDPPAWVKALEQVVMILLEVGIAVFLITVILRGIFRILRAFNDKTPENEDEIRSVEPEDRVTRIKSERTTLTPLQNRTRRRYRRMILRYRKDRPAPSETPTEIEARTQAPNPEELQTLHLAYEKARYGKS